MDWLKYLLPTEIEKVEENLARLKTAKAELDRSRQIAQSDEVMLAELNPYFAGQIYRVLVRCNQIGLRAGLFCGYRSFEEQDKLYKIGRQFDGSKWIKVGKVVTNASAGRSWHNYGLAADIVMDASNKPDLQPTWAEFVDANKDGVNDWKQIGEIGKALFLEWGGDFKDPAPVDVPHWQFHNGIFNIDTAILIKENFGIRGVWNNIKPAL